MRNVVDELNPPPRRLMGPGPVDADPRVLRAMSMPLLGQFDPAFTEYMNEVMALYRQVLRTDNRWTFLVDGTARAGIEAAMVSLLAPGDRVLAPIFGRFGHLLCEVAARCGATCAPSRPSGGRCSSRTGSRPPSASTARPSSRSCTATPPPRWRSPSPRSARSAASTTRSSTWTRPRPSAAWTSGWTTGGSTCCRRASRSASRGRRGRPPSRSTSGSSAGAGAQTHRAGDPPGRLRGRGRPRRALELLRPRDADGLLERQPPQPPHRGDLDAVRGARVRPDRARGGARRTLRAARAGEPRPRRRARRDGARALRRPGPQDGQRHRGRDPRGGARRCGAGR